MKKNNHIIDSIRHPVFQVLKNCRTIKGQTSHQHQPRTFEKDRHKGKAPKSSGCCEAARVSTRYASQKKNASWFWSAFKTPGISGVF